MSVSIHDPQRLFPVSAQSMCGILHCKCPHEIHAVLGVSGGKKAGLLSAQHIPQIMSRQTFPIIDMSEEVFLIKLSDHIGGILRVQFPDSFPFIILNRHIALFSRIRLEFDSVCIIAYNIIA